MMYAKVRFAVPGFHRWPEAPPRRAYLRDRHRHLFVFNASVEARHDARDVEYHDLLDAARDAVGSIGSEPCPAGEDLDFGDMSCERIAQLLAGALQAEYPGRAVRVGVSEDGECGAEVHEPARKA